VTERKEGKMEGKKEGKNIVTNTGTFAPRTCAAMQITQSTHAPLGIVD
jgi:hypothetical protein